MIREVKPQNLRKGRLDKIGDYLGDGANKHEKE
jgi:hypothetical protein